VGGLTARTYPVQQDHTIMKTIPTLLALITAAAFTGCSTTPSQRDYSGMPATHIVATVSCSDPSMKFTGTIVSDGHSRQLSGIGSGTFRATGHEIICSFKKTGVDGQISISVSEADKQLGGSHTGSMAGVRAEILRTPIEQHTVFTTF
jgi:hypothetical protein